MLPSSVVSSTGKQSATMMVQASCRCDVMQASATSPSLVARSIAITWLPCTCFKNTGRLPMADCSAARLPATFSGTSPTWSPRFMVSKGTLEIPPCRVVKTARTPGGAGQSGISQSGFKIRAARRLRLLKRRQGHACFVRGHGARQAVKTHLEALRVENLRHQAAVGQRRRVAMAKL